MGDRKPTLWGGWAPHQRAPSVQPVRSIISRHALSRQEIARVTSVSAAAAHNMFTSWHVDSGGLKNHYKPVEREAKSKLFPRGSDGSENIFRESRSLVNNSLFFFCPPPSKKPCVPCQQYLDSESTCDILICHVKAGRSSEWGLTWIMKWLKQWIVLTNRDLSIPQLLLFPAS